MHWQHTRNVNFKYVFGILIVFFHRTDRSLTKSARNTCVFLLVTQSFNLGSNAKLFFKTRKRSTNDYTRKRTKQPCIHTKSFWRSRRLNKCNSYVSRSFAPRTTIWKRLNGFMWFNFEYDLAIAVGNLISVFDGRRNATFYYCTRVHVYSVYLYKVYLVFIIIIIIIIFLVLSSERVRVSNEDV